jgi:hypothetical protein
MRVEGIKMDDGINTIIAYCDEDNFQLDINNETVVTAKDDTILNGDVGLFVETFESAEAAVVFNDLVIKKP